MSKRVILSTASSNRRQPLLHQSDSCRKMGTRLGEVVGGTAAVCCCSIGLANILYLAVYKVPASLCQKALRKKRHRRVQSMREELMSSQRRCICGCCDDIVSLGQIYPLCCDDTDLMLLRRRISVDKDTEVVELENKMWDRFYGSGFWRSPSQRDDSSSSSQRHAAPVSASSNLHVLAVN